MKKTTTGRRRLERDLTANTLTLNQGLRRILGIIRTVNADPQPPKAKLLLANKVLLSLDFMDPVSGPHRKLMFDPKTRTWFAMASVSWRCVETLVECANSGELDRFRECRFCKRWFFAHRVDQRCCPTRFDPLTGKKDTYSCRQKLHASSPQAKEQRRLDMRRFRAEAKKRESRQEQAYRAALAKEERGRYEQQAKRSHRPN